MQNWRADLRGNAVRAYKYQIIDESIYIDILKFNQFLDSIFNKLLTLDISKVSNITIGKNTCELKFKQSIKCLEFENVDKADIISTLNRLLKNIGFVNCNTNNYNTIIIKDGNYEYIHNSDCSDEIMDEIRRNLIEKGIL